MRATARISFLILTALTLGCGNPSAPQTPAPPIVPVSIARDMIGGIKFEVRGKGESRNDSGEEFRELSVGNNKLRIEGERILANGKEVESVQPGDSVLLDID